MRERLLIILIIIALALGAVVCILHGNLVEERATVTRLNHNIRTLVEDAKVRYVRDSLRASEAWALVLQVDELEKLRAKDAELIKDLKIRLRDVRAVTNIETVYHDTVILYVDTTDIKTRDDILSYRDEWADISFFPSDSTLTYSFRDSVTSVLHVHYLRRFLWWRWRPVYRVSTVSHNPRCVSVSGETAVVKDD